MFNSRLIGRSVWNTRWLLIIPGARLDSDPQTGVNLFIYGNPEGTPNASGGVTDIKLFLKSYSYQRLGKPNE